VTYYADMKAIHAFYSNQNGGNDDDACLGAAAYTMDKKELTIFLQDCQLLDKHLPKMELELMFIRVNWSPEAGLDEFDVSNMSSSEKINRFEDSASELSVSEFAHLLLRVSQARLPHKKRFKNVAKHFTTMLEEHVLPNARRDQLAFLRDSFSTDKQLRHVVYMYRRKLSAVFRKNCGPLKGDRNDKTSRDHLSMRAFTSIISSSGLLKRFDLALKDVTLVFLQSQSEGYDQFDGAVDNEMNYNEFLESLLRLGVTHAGGASYLQTSLGSLREAILPVLDRVGWLDGGELDGR